jgi:hypothetical protein
MWINVEVGNDVHTVPVDDIREHEPSEDCWCEPEYYVDIGLIVHNSADGREKFETGERKPS